MTVDVASTARPSWRERIHAAWPALAIGAAWSVFALNFIHLTAVRHTDAQVNYDFLRRMVGEHVPGAVAYQFGLAIGWLPAYGVGRAIASLGPTAVDGVPMPQAMIAFGSIVYVLATMLVAYLLLRRLDLRYAGTAALFALFGSPLFFLGSFSPLRTAPVETFLLALALLPMLAVFRSGPSSSRNHALAAGALLAAAATVRWFNAAEAIAAVACLFAFRRRREAFWLAASAAVTTGLLLLVPVGLGVTLFQSHGYGADLLAFSPLTLPRMLFTDYRGLFVWTPLTILSLIGYARLIRRRRLDRPFVVTAGIMGLALAAAYEAYPAWDAGFSFSARYLAPLYPVFALGLAGIADVRPRVVWSAAVAATAWTLFLALNVGLPFGGYGDETGKATQLAGRLLDGRMTPGRFLEGVWHGSHVRRAFQR